MGTVSEKLVCYLPGYRRMPLVFALSIVVVACMGALVAADDAVPGDVLFPLDRALERGYAVVISTPQERGEFAVDQAHERALELSRIRSIAAEVGEQWGNEELSTTLLQESLVHAQETLHELRNEYNAEGASAPQWLIRAEQRLELLNNRLRGIVPLDAQETQGQAQAPGIRGYLGN